MWEEKRILDSMKLKFFTEEKKDESVRYIWCWNKHMYRCLYTLTYTSDEKCTLDNCGGQDYGLLRIRRQSGDHWSLWNTKTIFKVIVMNILQNEK